MSTALMISAITLGFLGSFHCVGMCGAIALSLPVQNLLGWKKVIGILAYNVGRVVTYALLGGVLGSLGNVFSFWGWQQGLSIALGVALLGFCVWKLWPKKMVQPRGIPWRWNQKIIALLAPLFQSKKISTPFFIGLLNGLLPCGLVYLAIAGAVATHHTLDGVMFMAFFGLGTMPAMIVACFSGQLLSMKWRNRIKKSAPLVLGGMGLVLILRGANLDIPYLSPAQQHDTISCCHR